MTCVAGAAIFAGAGPASAAKEPTVHGIDKVETKGDNVVVHATYSCDASSKVKFVYISTQNENSKDSDDQWTKATCNGSKQSASVTLRDLRPDQEANTTHIYATLRADNSSVNGRDLSNVVVKDL